MDWLAGQLAILCQGPDGEENAWMQLLVFIVLAVFWAIGGIVKARNTKAQEEKQKRQTPPRPPRQRPSLQKILEAPPEKVSTKPMLAKAMKMANQMAKDKTADSVVEMEAVQDVPRPKEKVEDKPKVPAELATVERKEFELATADQLRVAIIHYEIFGKCIALRGSEEQIWMR